MQVLRNDGLKQSGGELPAKGLEEANLRAFRIFPGSTQLESASCPSPVVLRHFALHPMCPARRLPRIGNPAGA